MPLRPPRHVLILLACALGMVAGTAQASRYRVVGHATDWSATHARTLERIDTLIFAFARVERGRVVLDDVKPGHDGLYQSYGHYGGRASLAGVKEELHRPERLRTPSGFAGEDCMVVEPAHACLHHLRRPRSIAAKDAYVKAHGLGGVMYWQQEHDPEGELVDAIWQELQDVPGEESGARAARRGSRALSDCGKGEVPFMPLPRGRYEGRVDDGARRPFDSAPLGSG